MWNWIAYDLRFQRMKRGLSGQDLAKVLNVARSSVSRLENNVAKIDDGQALKLDKLWNTGGHFTLMLWYARLGHDPDWFRQHVDIEVRSSVIKIWENALVPGLLQTEDYAKAALKAGAVRDLEEVLAGRMARQEILARDEPPVLWVLLWEPVLEVPVGGKAVMRAQLAHLLKAIESPNIAIRVVPKHVGAHPGLDGAFKIMTTETGDVAFAESPGGGRLVPSAAEVRSYILRYDRIGQHAMPEEPSRVRIVQAMEAMQ
ncbi:helix-turn-helix domain-containing protein [Actinoallomurus bryophytorum]|nr:helix-turn-helix transcriptional regulator [Actinoallomurus bryophytorum]